MLIYIIVESFKLTGNTFYLFLLGNKQKLMITFC